MEILAYSIALISEVGRVQKNCTKVKVYQGAVINTRGIETAFERSVDRVIVSLSQNL